MPEIVRPDGARIHYLTHGEGFPVLLLAPGGSASRIDAWDQNFYHPARALAGRFRVIAMDQRHAGRSHAPAAPYAYEQTVADQLAVLDELGVDQAHVVAAGSGCAHALRLAHDAPGRVRALVCQEPVGRDESNTLGTFFHPFDEAMRWARAEGVAGVVAAAVENGRFDVNPGAGPFAQRLHDDPAFRDEIAAVRRENYIASLVRFRDGLWPDGSCWFSVPEDFPARLTAPLLVLPGDAPDRPAGIAKRLAAEAPQARLLPAGFDAPERQEQTVADIAAFLDAHTPS